MSKLPPETVYQIRILYDSKQMTQKALAEKYGVSQPLISKIVNRLIYQRETNLMMSGKADVKVGYKYGN